MYGALVCRPLFFASDCLPCGDHNIFRASARSRLWPPAASLTPVCSFSCLCLSWRGARNDLSTTIFTSCLRCSLHGLCVNRVETEHSMHGVQTAVQPAPVFGFGAGSAIMRMQSVLPAVADTAMYQPQRGWNSLLSMLSALAQTLKARRRRGYR